MSAPRPARAEFLCDGPNPNGTASNLTCTNKTDDPGPGPVGAVSTSTGDATSINAAGATSVDIATSSQSGNATTKNAGSVFGTVTTTTVDGNATTNNSSTGIIYGGVFTHATGNGNATTNNSGLAAQITTETDGTGKAVTNNSGLTTLIVTYTTGGGDAATLNSSSGIAIGGLDTHTDNGGNATTTNAGYVGFPGGIGISTITNNGGNATATNSGTVLGDIDVEAAVNSGSGNAAFSNSGSVTSGYNGVNVLTYSGNASFKNSGTIDASLGLPPYAYDTGIFVGSQDGNASATNTGRILGGIGVAAGDFGTATFTNAGLIDGTKSPFGVAIDMTQYGFATKSTLNLLPGSRIIGSIILNGLPHSFALPPTTVNIYSRDMSSVLTFGDVCGCGSLTETGAKVNVIGGSPFVIHNDTVAVLDPTSFAAQDRNVLDFTRTVLSAASSRLTSPAPMSGNGSAAMGFAPSGNVARDMASDAFANIPALSYAGQDRVLRSNPNFTASDGTNIWAQGFGGVRVQSADGPNLRSVNEFYGGIIGLDKLVRPDLKVGGFAGGGNITSQIDMNAGRTSSDIGFGGVFGRYAMSNRAFLDFALLAGGSSNNVKRSMSNNFAAGGYEYTNANYTGWFVSPELAYGVKQDIAKNWTMTPTARVRYLAANFGGYQESGSSTDLAVAGRTTHNFEERGELAFTRTTSEREGSLLRINATVGALAWQRAGGSGVNTVLLGQALAFATPGNANVFGGYVGGGFDWRTASGLSIFGAAEVQAMSDSSNTVTGHGGVKMAF